MQSLIVLMRNVSEWTSWLFVSVCLSSCWFHIPLSLPLNIPNISISLPPWLAAPLPLPLPLPLTLPHFLYSLLFPLSLSLYTRLPPYFIPPILFTPPAAIQYGHGYLHIRQVEWNYCAKQPVMFHCQLTQTMQSFTAVDILSLTCGLRQWYVLGPAQERTHWQRMNSNICRVAPESCYKQMT